MRQKTWYTISIECIKFNASFTVKVGEITDIVKVKSIGLAYQTAEFLETIYKPEYFKLLLNNKGVIQNVSKKI